MDKRITIPIGKIKKETETVYTFTFFYDLKAKPGQFIMLTDLEGGEKPFSIADCTENEFSITVKKIGEFTTRLFKKNVGDLISIRGAYGSSFFISKKKVLLVGGGYGIPPLYFLSKELLKNKADITVVNGARTKDDLLFSDRFLENNLRYILITDDGSENRKGTVVDVVNELLEKESFDMIYSAGPDKMMKALQNRIKDIDYEFLFERYMKCAIGICGQCTLDPIGIRVCVEGPVLGKKLVEQLTEFGKYHRDAAGKRIEY
ncbi:MAG: dihydroorotate dehydrogenase electron transfer subunit [Candidatus Cloacimonetes bacterium]|nr:dihydroorotate dehydrogenase electron transfer subunit [Candidatus Cloacimonadota bacterium]